MPYVTDTHALVWFLTKSPQMGKAAMHVMREAAAGREVIVIPTIVLGELMNICQAGKAPLDFSATLDQIESGDNYRIFPLDLAVVKVASEIPPGLEMHDRFIIATARLLELPLLTRDKEIIESRQVTVVW